MHSDPDVSKWHKTQVCDKFFSVISVWLHFFYLYFGLLGWMILMKEHISPTTTTMEMDERHFYSDHRNSCYEEKMFHWVMLC